MPYTMYEKLGQREPKPTRMSLELADRSIQYPRGIVENVLIKVDKFILPIDFVILDMPKDSRIPIILGRPFLATARAMIDVFNKKITLRVGDDEDLERGVNQIDLDNCNHTSNRIVGDSDIKKVIWHIESFDTAYLEEQRIDGLDNIMSEHLYSVSASEIDEKKRELKSLPSHLEYAYLNGNDSFPLIISSKLSERKKKLLLQVLEKHKRAMA
ncbi:DNA-directed DNA polymerase [Tanacetum coccineum]